MTLEELLEQLKELKRPSSVLGHTEFFPVISRDHFSDVEMLIRQYALDNHDSELGILKAKVYAYEKIIANSNFAPMLIDNHVSVEPIFEGAKNEDSDRD